MAEEAGDVFSIDPVLLEILKPEVAGHLETVDAWLAAIERRWVVRANDAHAWAMVWLDGAWRDLDTTPPAAGGASAGLARAAGDLAAPGR